MAHKNEVLWVYFDVSGKNVEVHSTLSGVVRRAGISIMTVYRSGGWYEGKDFIVCRCEGVERNERLRRGKIAR